MFLIFLVNLWIHKSRVNIQFKLYDKPSWDRCKKRRVSEYGKVGNEVAEEDHKTSER